MASRKKIFKWISRISQNESDNIDQCLRELKIPKRYKKLLFDVAGHFSSKFPGQNNKKLVFQSVDEVVINFSQIESERQNRIIGLIDNFNKFKIPSVPRWIFVSLSIALCVFMMYQFPDKQVYATWSLVIVGILNLYFMINK